MSQGEQRSNDGRKPDNRGVPIRAEKSPKLNHGKGSVKRPGSSHAARFPEKRNVPKLVLEACWRFVWYAIGLVGVGLMLFLCLRPSSDVEIVQIWLPHRYASVMDVLWSWAGLAAVWALMSLLRWTVRRARARARHHGDVASTMSSRTSGRPLPPVPGAARRRA